MAFSLNTMLWLFICNCSIYKNPDFFKALRLNYAGERDGPVVKDSCCQASLSEFKPRHHMVEKKN